jgi:hypothetical protein
MPKIGQKITVVGILSEGKQGFWFAFNNAPWEPADAGDRASKEGFAVITSGTYR